MGSYGDSALLVKVEWSIEFLHVRAHSHQSVMNMIFRRWTELHIIVFALEIRSSGVRLGAGLEKLRSPLV
jgi:hypothetical protein